MARVRSNLSYRVFMHQLTFLQHITTDPETITTLKGTTIPRLLSCHTCSFSAHVDGAQNIEFIDQIKAQHVVRVLFKFEKDKPTTASLNSLRMPCY